MFTLSLPERMVNPVTGESILVSPPFGGTPPPRKLLVKLTSEVSTGPNACSAGTVGLGANKITLVPFDIGRPSEKAASTTIPEGLTKLARRTCDAGPQATSELLEEFDVLP
mmetsp:Transcript_14494/g.43153  ORF Transcript_14494/g.43153 Transcript_14494/m.43153 type:complete len:111 (-) Transcript_14494:198-530(-)